MEAAKRTIEQLSDEVDSLKKAAAVRVEPGAPRSPPAKGGLPKVRPDESDDSDESVCAKGGKGIGRSSAGSDGDGDDDGSGWDSAKSTTARKRRPTVGELAKDDSDLARQLHLADKANAIKYMMAHGRVPGGASSDESGDAGDPAGTLARGGARLLQLGARQMARLDRRLQKRRSATRPSRRRLARRRQQNRPIRQGG